MKLTINVTQEIINESLGLVDTEIKVPTMTIQEVKDMLPLRVEVTKEIIEKSNRWYCGDCIGFNTLVAAFPNAVPWSWGREEGSLICTNGTVRISATNEQNWGVDMMEIKTPREVILRFEYTH